MHNAMHNVGDVQCCGQNESVVGFENLKNGSFVQMGVSVRESASGVRGVYYVKHGNRRWGGKVSVNGKPKYLGLFMTKEGAAKAVEDARRKYGLSETRTRSVPAIVPPYKLAFEILTERDPGLAESIMGQAKAMTEAAKILDCKPSELPEGWDLA